MFSYQNLDFGLTVSLDIEKPLFQGRHFEKSNMAAKTVPKFF